MAALGCAGDVLHSSQEDRFSDMTNILFPLMKKVTLMSTTHGHFLRWGKEAPRRDISSV